VHQLQLTGPGLLAVARGRRPIILLRLASGPIYLSASLAEATAIVERRFPIEFWPFDPGSNRLGMKSGLRPDQLGGQPGAGAVEGWFGCRIEVGEVAHLVVHLPEPLANLSDLH
jgi:hypothetical protein